jgi:hypothetical protein
VPRPARRSTLVWLFAKSCAMAVCCVLLNPGKKQAPTGFWTVVECCACADALEICLAVRHGDDTNAIRSIFAGTALQ